MSIANVADGQTRVFIGREICGPYMNLNYYVVIRGKGDSVIGNRIMPISYSLELICRFSKCVDDEAINVDIQYRTRKPLNNHEAQVNIACGNPHFFKQIICPNTDGWTDLARIPKVKPYAVCENVQFYSIELRISVHELSKNKCADLLYNDESFTDFNLSTENGSCVPVHRACMAAHSDVFKTMLVGEWKETANGCLRMKGLQVTLDTLQHLKDYMYLRTLPEDGLRPLLLIADCYMMRDLRYRCIWKLAQTVTPDNLLDLLEFATLNKIADLSVAILTVTPKSVVHDVYLNLQKERHKQIDKAGEE